MPVTEAGKVLRLDAFWREPVDGMPVLELRGADLKGEDQHGGIVVHPTAGQWREIFAREPKLDFRQYDKAHGGSPTPNRIVWSASVPLLGLLNDMGLIEGYSTEDFLAEEPH